MNNLIIRLAQLCEAEGIVITPGALTLLAQASAESQRDAENLLERLISSYSSPLTEEHVQDMLELSLDNADAYFERANTHLGLNQYREAIADLTDCIRLDPEYPSAHNNRGWSYYNVGDVQRAIEDYHEAVRVDPKNAQLAYVNMSAAYDRLGNAGQAEIARDHALDIVVTRRLRKLRKVLKFALTVAVIGWFAFQWMQGSISPLAKATIGTLVVLGVIWFPWKFVSVTEVWGILKFASATLVVLGVIWFARVAVSEVDEWFRAVDLRSFFYESGGVSTWDEDMQRDVDEFMAEFEDEVREEADRIERGTREWKEQNPVLSY